MIRLQLACLLLALAAHMPAQEISLPSSKNLHTPVPGSPQRTNSFPTAVALSPDGKYLAILNNGRIEQVGSPAEVYDNPANAFIYGFLGDVNLFHERAYARPYELEISRTPEDEGAVAATIRYIGAAGPVVKLELLREDNGDRLDAELSRERYRELKLKVGDTVGVMARNLRVFSAS